MKKETFYQASEIVNKIDAVVCAIETVTEDRLNKCTNTRPIDFLHESDEEREALKKHTINYLNKRKKQLELELDRLK